MQIDHKRVENLTQYVRLLMSGGEGKELYQKYRNDIERVNPLECFEIFNNQLNEGFSAQEILVHLDKFINAFYKSLNNYKNTVNVKNRFLEYLNKENEALAARLDNIKAILKEKKIKDSKNELLDKMIELLAFKDHYQKKENILFPYMEKKAGRFNGLSIMWALHDETVKRIERTIELLQKNETDDKELSNEIGKLFFSMYGLKLKEELILFPAAAEIIEEDEWDEMHQQSFEFGFPFVEKPEI